MRKFMTVKFVVARWRFTGYNDVFYLYFFHKNIHVPLEFGRIIMILSISNVRLRPTNRFGFMIFIIILAIPPGVSRGKYV